MFWWQNLFPDIQADAVWPIKPTQSKLAHGKSTTWLNTIGTTKALCPAKLQARQEQQSNKIPDQLATPEQVHGGQLGVVLDGYSHV